MYVLFVATITTYLYNKFMRLSCTVSLIRRIYSTWFRRYESND